MATYLEIYTIRDQAGYSDWANRMSTAVRIKAHTIAQQPTPTAEQVAWAKSALENPDGQRSLIEGYVLAQFNDQPIATILGITDAQMQTGVDGAVDNLLSK